MNESDRIRLTHMLEAAEEAVRIHALRSQEDLSLTRMATLAVMKDIEIIGEAASRVSPELRDAKPAVPWAAIVAMRNRLVHAYFDIAVDVVWSTVESDLPLLIAQVREILAECERDSV